MNPMSSGKEGRVQRDGGPGHREPRPDQAATLDALRRPEIRTDDENKVTYYAYNHARNMPFARCRY
jgi:hypothetical protein